MGGPLPVIHLILRHFVEAGGPILHQFIMIEAGAHFFCSAFFWVTLDRRTFFFPSKSLGYYSIKKSAAKIWGLTDWKRKIKVAPKAWTLWTFVSVANEHFLPTVGLRKKKYRRDFFNSSSLKIYRAPKEKDRLPAIFFQGLC